MTLPGFTGPEVSMQPLNNFLNSNGYVARHWGLGCQPVAFAIWNTWKLFPLCWGPMCSVWPTNISVRSHSSARALRGVFAREIARCYPDVVDRVITLGSPTHFDEGGRNVNAMVARVMAFYTGRPVEDLLREVQELKLNMSEPPAGVPARVCL